MAEPESSPETIEDPPPVPADLVQAWETILPRIRSEKIRNGLRWWLAGHSWRDSARRVGIASHQALVTSAERYGLTGLNQRTDRLIRAHRTIALEAADEQIHRLREDPEAISTRDLTVMSGVSTDKVRDFEGWNRKHSDPGPYTSALEQIASHLAHGERIDLSVSITRSRDERVVEGESVHEAGVATGNLPPAPDSAPADDLGEAKVRPHNSPDSQD